MGSCSEEGISGTVPGPPGPAHTGRLFADGVGPDELDRLKLCPGEVLQRSGAASAAPWTERAVGRLLVLVERDLALGARDEVVAIEAPRFSRGFGFGHCGKRFGRRRTARAKGSR